MRRYIKVVSPGTHFAVPQPIPRSDRRRGLRDRSVGSWLGILNLDKVAMTLEGRTNEDPYAVVAPILLLVRVGRMSKQYRTLSELHVAPAVTNSREGFQFQGAAHAKRTNSAPRTLIRGSSPTTIDPPVDAVSSYSAAIRSPMPFAMRSPTA